MALDVSAGRRDFDVPWLGRTADPPERYRAWLFLGLCCLIALAPLPLGSARPVAWDVLALAVALLLLASLRLKAADFGAFARPMAVPALCFALVAAFVLVQVSRSTPPAWHNPVWDMAREAGAGRVQGSIAMDRGAALAGLLRLLSYAGVLLLSVMLCRARERALAALRLVAYSGGIYAGYGLLAYAFGGDTLLWLRKWAYLGDLTGTFVNKNSFATYLGLCFLAALTALIAALQQVDFAGRWQDKLAAAIDFLSRRPALVVCLFLLPTALLLTHSRGGLIATLAGAVALGLAVSQAPGLRRLRRLRLAALPVALAILAFLISGDRVVERMLGAEGDLQARGIIYAATRQAVDDHPILGTGLGSFEAVFPIYRPPGIWGHVNLAHSDYLQNVLELGFPAAALLVLALAWLFGLCLRGVMQRRRDAAYPCLGVAATVLVGLHATVDFSLQIPAVTVTYLFLLGAAVAQSLPTRDRQSGGVSDAPRQRPPS
jgi:O-antigen ligase